MVSVSKQVGTRELRDELADVVARVSYRGERIGVTKNGRLAAVMISVDDLELLEQLEDARDLAEYRVAKAEDDGTRVPLAALMSELAG
jgi:prevent-host-death family protein